MTGSWKHGGGGDTLYLTSSQVRLLEELGCCFGKAVGCKIRASTSRVLPRYLPFGSMPACHACLHGLPGLVLIFSLKIPFSLLAQACYLSTQSLRQGDANFKTCLGCRVSLRSAWEVQSHFASKQKAKLVPWGAAQCQSACPTPMRSSVQSQALSLKTDKNPSHSVPG